MLNTMEIDSMGHGVMDFVSFKKISRLSRDCIITEKIDGTNGCITIRENSAPIVLGGGKVVPFLVGSRKRWIFPENDNYGFAKWAYENADELLKLGPGRHFGEWWGQGIQRKYGMKEKVFSLFNTRRWCLPDQEPKLISIDPKTKIEKWQEKLPKCCRLVPVITTGLFTTNLIEDALVKLWRVGSYASPNYMNPEGIVIYHIPSGYMFKKTIKNDEKQKEETDNIEHE